MDHLEYQFEPTSDDETVIRFLQTFDPVLPPEAMASTAAQPWRQQPIVPPPPRSKRQRTMFWKQGETMTMRSLIRLRVVLALLIACVCLGGAGAATFISIRREATDTVVSDTYRAILMEPRLRPLAEVQVETPFSIYEPTILPGGYRFAGAYYHEPVGNGVTLEGLSLEYANTSHPTATIAIDQMPIAEVCASCTSVGASANIEIVDINGAVGSYVLGFWDSTSNESTWNPNYDLQALSWEQDGFAFTIRASRVVSKTDLLAMARSFRLYQP